MNKLEKAQKNLDDFLNENPHMRKFQEEIDNVLKNVKNPRDRLAVLMDWILDKKQEAIEVFNNINENCKIIKKELKK